MKSTILVTIFILIAAFLKVEPVAEKHIKEYFDQHFEEINQRLNNIENYARRN